MNSTDINGDFNESLRDDAEQFGGENESAAVPTHHLRVTSADLAHFADTKETLIVGDGADSRGSSASSPPEQGSGGEVALVWRQDPPEDPPNADFVVFVSETALERLASGGVVNYGVRHINGKNQTLHISKGGVSDLFEDDRSPKERIRQEEPHLEDYVR